VFLAALIPVFAILIPTLISFVLHSFYQVPDVQDWNDRAELYDGPITLLRENLMLGVTQSSMMDPNGFTLALFSSPTSTTFNKIPCPISECSLPPARIVIDTFGLIWRVQEYDFLALRALAESTSPFVEAWSLATSITCQPTDYIIIPVFNVTLDAISYTYTAVSAFTTGRNQLEAPVAISDGRIFTTLPEEIDVFLRLALQRKYSEAWGPRISKEGKNVIKDILTLLK